MKIAICQINTIVGDI